MIQENEILRIEKVSKNYNMRKHQTLKAVSEVDLTVHAGECVAIVGESGCGKSTLAKLITHMEPVSSGKIFFENHDIMQLKQSQIKEYYRQVQMIFQTPSAVFSPRMKIGTFLMEPWINYKKMSRKKAKEYALQSLASVELDPSYADKYPHQLSGGELQRVAIARAISISPKLIICDEATSALDVSIQDQILKLLEDLRKQTGVTCIFISHDLAVTERISDRIVVMYLGKVVEIMKSDHIKSRARHPYTQSLLQSIFSVHSSKEEPIHVLSGEPQSPVNLGEGCVFCTRCSHASDKCKIKQPPLYKLEDESYVACDLYAPD